MIDDLVAGLSSPSEVRLINITTPAIAIFAVEMTGWLVLCSLWCPERLNRMKYWYHEVGTTSWQSWTKHSGKRRFRSDSKLVRLIWFTSPNNGLSTILSALTKLSDFVSNLGQVSPTSISVDRRSQLEFPVIKHSTWSTISLIGDQLALVKPGLNRGLSVAGRAFIISF